MKVGFIGLGIDLLSKERSLRSAPAAHPAAVVSTDTSRTLPAAGIV